MFDSNNDNKFSATLFNLFYLNIILDYILFWFIYVK